MQIVLVMQFAERSITQLCIWHTSCYHRPDNSIVMTEGLQASTLVNIFLVYSFIIQSLQTKLNSNPTIPSQVLLVK